MQETRVPSLGQEDRLEKGMAAHPSLLAWRIPWPEEPVGCSLRGCKESDMAEQLILSLFTTMTSSTATEQRALVAASKP